MEQKKNMSFLSRSHRKLLVLVAVTVALSVTGLSLLERPGERGSHPVPTTPVSSADAREVAHLQSVDEMIGTADLIVLGNVSKVRHGRAAGAPDETRIQMREVTLDHLTVLKGEPNLQQVSFEELGWVNDRATSLNGSRYANEGDRVVVALVAEEYQGRTIFRLASTQTRFFVTGSGRLEPNYLRDEARHADGLASSVADRFTAERLADYVRARR